MRPAPVLAVLFAAFLAVPAPGTLPPGDPACDRAMPVYGSGWPAPTPGRRLELTTPAGGALVYLAVRHTSDPADSQLGTIEREARRLRPTLILYEGDARGVGSDRRDTVRRFGEAGFVRHLARELGVAARSFDASAAEQMAFIAGRFDPEEVKIYYVLREIWLLRERQGKPPAEVERLARRIIQGDLLPQLPKVLTTEAEFARAFAGRWPPGVRWTEPRAAWFDPYKSSRASGGAFTNDLERAATVFRDTYMYRTVAAAVLRGERVLAVAGSGHLPVQEPALRCALR